MKRNKKNEELLIRTRKFAEYMNAWVRNEPWPQIDIDVLCRDTVTGEAKTLTVNLSKLFGKLCSWGKANGAYWTSQIRISKKKYNFFYDLKLGRGYFLSSRIDLPEYFRKEQERLLSEDPPKFD